jgi:hypothetical protein
MREWYARTEKVVPVLTMVTLVAAALGLIITVYQSAATSIRLMRGPTVTVEGVVTEKLAVAGGASLEAPVFLARYAFPTPQGQIRNGEQTLTRDAYEQLGRPGSPVLITIRQDNPAINAVDPRLVFPGTTGWRLGLAAAFAILAYAVLLLGVLSERKARG